ncbi:hypothetical protein BC832DRAFT_553203 [Gaertneriomyces semiglobifer]|nr:hypothetical protein BC832DRAFT_553203 [Gaertneriomyces semiglobifer]
MQGDNQSSEIYNPFGLVSTPTRVARPRSKADYEDVIERTDEYETFMNNLEQFLLARGAALQREPVLGGKKLDMLKIYKWVIDAGGFEAVTQARGWKRMAEPFNLPSTCTNSAYVIKQVYQKYLLDWEHANYPNGPPNAPMLPVSAPNSPTPPHPPPLWNSPPVKSVIPETPIPRAETPSSPDTRGKRRAAAAAAAAIASPGSIASTPVPSGRRQDEPLFKRLRTMAEASLASKPASTPQSTRKNSSMPPLQQLIQPTRAPPAINMILVNPDDDGRDEKYLYGAWKNRLTLALSSDLPNEVDWAFNKLIRLSYSRNFFLGVLPGLFEALLDHLSCFFSDLAITQHPNGLIETVSTQTNLRQLFADAQYKTREERTLQTLHILRNMSFYADNALMLAKSYDLLTILAKSIALPHLQITTNALDILENITPYILLRGQNDFFLTILHQHAFSDDKYIILTSVTSLTRLLNINANKKIIHSLPEKTIDSILKRFLELLLVPDEDIVNCVLEWFYEFTTGGNGIGGQKVVKCVGFNVLRVFVKFLSWAGFRKASTSAIASTLPSTSGTTSTNAPVATITKKEQPASSATAEENTAEAVETTSESMEISESYPCRFSSCEESYQSLQGLFEHLQKSHIPSEIRKTDRMDIDQSTELPVNSPHADDGWEWKCGWGGKCTWHCNVRDAGRIKIVKHLGTHLTTPPTTTTSKKNASGAADTATSVGSVAGNVLPPSLALALQQSLAQLPSSEEPSGIPLTAMLVLRNLFRAIKSLSKTDTPVSEKPFDGQPMAQPEEVVQEGEKLLDTEKGALGANNESCEPAATVDERLDLGDERYQHLFMTIESQLVWKWVHDRRFAQLGRVLGEVVLI